MNNILNNFQKNTNKENDNSSKNHNSSTEMGDGDKADAGVDSIELSNDQISIPKNRQKIANKLIDIQPLSQYAKENVKSKKSEDTEIYP